MFPLIFRPPLKYLNVSHQGVAIASAPMLGDALVDGRLCPLFGGRAVCGPYRYHLLHLPGAETRPEVAAVCAWIRDEVARDRDRAAA